MPLTSTGRKVAAAMQKQYGDRWKRVFYASINKGRPGSASWHKKGPGSRMVERLHRRIRESRRRRR